eukprot:c2356_g1_i1.p1 GENE.c2356_g1_i1~~c2356_g1_i1.p1  ORF type:complete len:208 (+),score=34.97 c2356_g1_i1:38-661(+)
MRVLAFLALVVAAEGLKELAEPQQAIANQTIQVAFDPLEPTQIVSQNLEVTSRIYRSCLGGDQNARWNDRSSSKSEPNGHCYMVFFAERTWFQARRACENLGGYLVTITSEDEMSFIWKKFGSLFTETWKGPWIGFSDAAHEGDWNWVTGESGVVGQDSVYANWYAGEPDDCCGGQDCASIAGGRWGYKWNDNKCHFLLPYICERDF